MASAKGFSFGARGQVVRARVTAGGPEASNDGGVHDLLELQDGVMADLATLDIPAGTYNQLRLIVESAQVTLAEGFEFADGMTTRRPWPSAKTRA